MDTSLWAEWATLFLFSLVLLCVGLALLSKRMKWTSNACAKIHNQYTTPYFKFWLWRGEVPYGPHFYPLVIAKECFPPLILSTPFKSQQWQWFWIASSLQRLFHGAGLVVLLWRIMWQFGSWGFVPPYALRYWSAFRSDEGLLTVSRLRNRCDTCRAFFSSPTAPTLKVIDEPITVVNALIFLTEYSAVEGS